MKTTIYLLLTLTIFSCKPTVEQKILKKVSEYKNSQINIVKFNKRSDKMGLPLKWDLTKVDTICYKVSMKSIKNEIEFDYGWLTDSISKGERAIKKMAENHRELEQKLNYYSVLSINKNRDIDTKIFTTGLKGEDSSFNSFMNLNKIFLNKAIVVRGEIDEHGTIKSFYVKQDQKNLLSIFYQLPDFPVEIGDSWNLDLEYIQLDQTFKCDSTINRNFVQFIELNEIENDTIAVLKYDIHQQVNGKLLSHFISSNSSNDYLSVKITGFGNFSITNGRWQSLNLIIVTDSGGSINQFGKQHLGLELIDNIPSEFYTLE